MALIWKHPHKGKKPPGVKDKGLPTWPWRCCIVGPPGSGKRNTALTILDRIDPFPDKIVVIHLDPERGGKDEYAMADEWHSPNAVPDFEQFDIGGVTPTEDDDDCVSTRTSAADPQRQERVKRTLVIIDEIPWFGLDKANRQRLRSLLNYVSTHANTSVIVQSQDYCAIDVQVRAACPWLILPGRTVNRGTLQLISKKIGCDSDEILELQGLLRGPYDSLSADSLADPRERWKLNLFTPIRRR